jgi:hypothetical protein
LAVSSRANRARKSSGALPLDWASLISVIVPFRLTVKLTMARPFSPGGGFQLLSILLVIAVTHSGQQKFASRFDRWPPFSPPLARPVDSPVFPVSATAVPVCTRSPTVGGLGGVAAGGALVSTGFGGGVRVTVSGTTIVSGREADGLTVSRVRSGSARSTVRPGAGV